MTSSSKKQRRGRTSLAAFTTATIASFSLTLLAAGIGILTGLLPLHALSFAQRLDVGSLLFIVPVVALILGVCFEVIRITLDGADLPEPRPQQTIDWPPGGRDG